MIAFSKLGNYDRLGNQLFQYAFLRDRARHLGVQFWCPEWEGDQIFDLADQGLRADSPSGLDKKFSQSEEAGYKESALHIDDNTDIEGYFQSNKYYADEGVVKQWFAFRDGIKNSALEKCYDIDFSTALSLFLRLDSDYAATREFFPLYPTGYYQKGLSFFDNYETILVFADRLDLAKEFLKNFPASEKFIYMEGLNPHEQLYLMSICGCGNIITNSTFAWWGAYLNLCKGARIVAPLEWCRPGVPVPIHGILPDDWCAVRSLRPIWDNFQLWRIRHPFATARRILTRLNK
ncbi:MAG: alpha-1,2-fucosyltransferase [Pseudomonadota bacterium]